MSSQLSSHTTVRDANGMVMTREAYLRSLLRTNRKAQTIPLDAEADLNALLPGPHIGQYSKTIAVSIAFYSHHHPRTPM
jgi:hypothetical protein